MNPREDETVQLDGPPVEIDQDLLAKALAEYDPYGGTDDKRNN